MNACFDGTTSEYYLGISKSDGFYFCYKVNADAKLVPFHGKYQQWQRRNGRLNRLCVYDLKENIRVV